MTTSYKIVLIGDEGVGKTSWVRRLSKGTFDKDEKTTLGVEVTPIPFRIMYRERKTLNIWDCSGNKKFKGLEKGHYDNADGCIIMFDTTREKTLDNVETWIRKFKQVRPDSPIVICGSKAVSGNQFGREFPRLSSSDNTNIWIPIKDIVSAMENRKKHELKGDDEYPSIERETRFWDLFIGSCCLIAGVVTYSVVYGVCRLFNSR